MKEHEGNQKKMRQIGERFSKFVADALKRRNESRDELVDILGISMEKLEQYLEGAEIPGCLELDKLGREYSLNINWLFTGHGPMTDMREVEFEELVENIEANDRYDHYKMLFVSMGFPVMENFMFSTHGAIVDLLRKLDADIEKDPQIAHEKILAMTQDTCY